MEELVEIKEMSLEYIPRVRDVIGYVFFLSQQNKKNATLAATYPSVVNKARKIWQEIGIPIQSYTTVLKKLKKVMTSYQKIRKVYRENDGNHNIQNSFDDVFSISSCACIPPDPKDFIECVCILSQNQKVLAQAIAENVNAEDSITDADCQTNHQKRPRSEMQDTDPDYVPPYENEIPSSVNIPLSIESLNLVPIVMEVVRRNISLRSAAVLINKTLEAIGFITPTQQGLVVSVNRLQRAVDRLGKEVSTEWDDETKPTECFFFDGKKDRNLSKVQRMHRTVVDNSILFENITIVQQPGDRYLGFVSSEESSALTIFTAVKNFFIAHGENLSELYAIGSDGAYTNTGANTEGGGIIIHFERHLERPLHWLICLLHLLEVVLKGVFTHLDGTTKGPNIYSGPIGRCLENLELTDVVEYTPILLENMPEDFDEIYLRNDQSFLLRLARAVSTGKCDQHLLQYKPGKMSACRWTVTASNVLRLYISKENPSVKLIELVTFLMKVYIPAWCWIKKQPSWVYGARHLFRIISFSRALQSSTFLVVMGKVKNNCYYAHTENLLLSMIVDDDKEIRQKAYDRIINARKQMINRGLVGELREFEKPSNRIIDVGADHYSLMIDWDNYVIHEPPYTMRLSLEELYTYRDSDIKLFVPEIPCHSQRTEFLVQAVSQAVNKRADHQHQDDDVKVKLVSRSIMPEFNAKKDYKFTPY